MNSKSSIVMKHTRAQTIVLISMCTAIIAVLSQFSIPLPSGVPITLQTFAIALTGYVLGPKAGCISTGIYILLGTIGVPIFSNFRGGISILFDKTGGFLFGFLMMSTLCGVAIRFKNRYYNILLVLFSLTGLISCHIVGTLQFSLLTHIDFISSAIAVSVPYLFKDAICVLLAYFTSLSIRKAVY